MVVLKKSQSHPDLLFCASPRWNSNLKNNKIGSSCSTASLESLDSDSSLVDVHSVVAALDKDTQHADKSTSTRSIGSLLWKLLISKQLGRTVTRDDWNRLREEYPKELSLSRVSTKDLVEYHAALSSIIIMDPNVDDRALSLLQDYNGHLVHVSKNMTMKLLEQAPDDYMALVGDFNDNLAYSMQSTRGIPTATSATTSNTTNTMSQEQWKEEIAQLEATLEETLSSPTVQLQASFLKTVGQTIPQPAHVDYPWQTLLDEQSNNLFLAFFPLTDQGMILQLWPSTACTTTATSSGSGEGTAIPKVRGQLVFVPLDKMLIVPCNTIHGGGFQTTSFVGDDNDASFGHGNVRFHLYIATQGTTLPVCAQNVYTLPDNRRVALSDVCVNAPGLEKDDNGHDDDDDDEALLMQLLFE